jgi:hypothetical protein
MEIPFEEWAKAEIARLHADADALERTLGKYVESKGKVTRATPQSGANGAERPFRIRPRTGKGGKREYVLARIAESGAGGTSTDDLFRDVTEAKLGMNRSSLRALLYTERNIKKTITSHQGRHILTPKGPSA